MLTPAEEVGLSGLALASRVRKAFYEIPEAEQARLIRTIRDESFRRHLIYLRDGEPDAVRVLACPMTASRVGPSGLNMKDLATHIATPPLQELQPT